MDALISLREHSDRTVQVRHRPYLAGSHSAHMPDDIPMANGEVLVWQGGRVSPAEAASACRSAIDSCLKETGSLILRRLPVANRTDFNAFMAAMDYMPHSYEGGIAVRERDAGHVLVASQEDARISMAPHNEMAYLPNYPDKVFFLCVKAAEDGGEVPINDVRHSIDRIPDAVLRKFSDKGIRYHRVLPRDSSGTEIGWRDTFGTPDRDALEAFMQAKGHRIQWLANEGLSYSYVRDAFLPDPVTAQPLWFNQVTELHSSYWREHPLFSSQLPDTSYPATTTYGDGEPIDSDLITSLRAALWQTSRAVAMQTGDLFVLDNTYVQHGRFSYTGTRLHLVSLTK